MGYHDSFDPLEVTVSTNYSMNAIAPGGSQALSTSLPGNYGNALGSNYGNAAGSNYGNAAGSNYGLSESPEPPLSPEDPTTAGFKTPDFGGKGSAKQSWNMARAGVKAGIIENEDGGKMDNKGNKTLSVGYRLELLDPKHRVADMLEVMHGIFLRRTDRETSQKLSLFFDWLDMVCREAPDTVYGVFKKYKISVVNNFIISGVTYLTAPGRHDYRVYFKAGLLYRGNKLMDSRDNSTVFSGKGWAIFVTNPSGQLYAASHAAGKFHHSSFLSGNPVMSAGELKVENGLLKVITAKSGHYKPNLEQFVAGVKEMKKRGANLDSAKLLMFKDKEEQLIPANFYLATPGVFKGLSIWG